MRSAVATPDSVPTQDFFVAGGTLRADAPSYVPRQADEDLHAALSKGEFCYVLTSRQMGKSSLMVRTAMRLREDDATVVILDLTVYGQDVTREQWYYSLLTTVGQRLDLEDELDDFWDDNEALTPIFRLMEAFRTIVLDRVEGRVVVFVDEIDVVQSLPFSTGEFFAAIRECYTRRAQDPDFERLTFCLLGVATPSELINDPLTTPFNVGRRVELTDLTASEAQVLADGLGQAASVSSQLIERAVHWTGGHPYLTQRLCREIAHRSDRVAPDDVDHLCEELFFSERAQEQDDNLQFVRNQILRRDLDHAALLTLYRTVHAGRPVRHDETNPLINVLQLSGIARAVDGHMRVRNRVYEHVFDAEWVLENMPDAELRRQRAAYRRGMLRAAGLATAILVVVTALAVYAMSQTRLARRASLRAQAEKTQARETTARSQIAQGVAMLDGGNELGLLRLVDAMANAPEGSELRGSAQRLWAGWYEPYANRVDLVIDIDSPSSVGFSADGKVLAAASGADGIHLFDAVSGDPVGAVLTPGATVNALQFSSDGSFLVAGDGDGRVHVWDARTWQHVDAVHHATRILAVAFSGDGTRFASLSIDSVVKVWDVATRRQVGSSHQHPWDARSVSLSQDGGMVAAAGMPFVYVWDTKTGAELYSHRFGGPGAQAAFSPNGPTLISCSSGFPVELAEPAADGPWQATRLPIDVDARSFSIHPDGRWIHIVGKGNLGAVWDIDTGEAVGLPSWSDRFGRSAFDPLRPRIAAPLPRDNRVFVWRIPVAQPSRRRPPTRASWRFLQSATFSPNGATLAVNRADATVLLLNAKTLRPTRPALRHGAGVVDVAFSPDGTRLATTSGDAGALHLWEVSSGQPLWVSHGPLGFIFSVSYSADGAVIATASASGVRLWDAATGAQVGDSIPVPALHGLSFSPTESVLAICAADGVALWEVDPRALRGHLKAGDETAMRAEFTSDGRYLAVSGITHNVRMWDMDTLEQVGGPLPTPHVATGVEFGPGDGMLMIADPPADTTRAWDMPTRLPIGPVIQEVVSPYSDWSFDPLTPRVGSPDYPYAQIRQLPAEPLTHREMQVRTWLAVGRRATDLGDVALLSASEFGDLREELSQYGRSESPPGLTAPVEALATNKHGSTFAFHGGDQTLQTDDAGVSWNVGPPLSSVGVVESRGRLYGASAGSRSRRRLVSSEDGGTSWIDEAEAPYIISVVPSGDGVAAIASDGALWTLADPGEAWTHHEPGVPWYEISGLHAADGELFAISGAATRQVYERGSAQAVTKWLEVLVSDTGEAPEVALTKDWLALGGSTSEAQRSSLAGFPHPMADVTGSPSGWHVLSSPDGVAHIASDESHDPDTHATAYLATVVHSPRVQTAGLVAGGNSGVAIWFNGDLLHRSARGELRGGLRGTALHHRFTVTLRRGANVLLMKAPQLPTEWVASARFVGAEGLSCSTDPAGEGEPLVLQSAHWLPLADTPATAKIAVLGSVGSTVYAGTDGHGVLRFDRETSAWESVSDGLPDVTYVYGVINLEETLFVATNHGVFRKPPGVERWESRSAGLTDNYITAIAASDDWTFAGTWEGRIFRSPDRGETWKQVYGARVDPATIAVNR
jgi:WD40 repeat protein